MRKLNGYGEEFIKQVTEGGRLEDTSDYFQVADVSVTQSQTNHLINLDVLTHTEEIYLYNNKKYKLDVYSEIECNELFTIPFSYTDEHKKELIENFIEAIYSNIFNYEIKGITEDEYNRAGDLAKEDIKRKIIKAII